MPNFLSSTIVHISPICDGKNPITLLDFGVGILRGSLLPVPSIEGKYFLHFPLTLLFS